MSGGCHRHPLKPASHRCDGCSRLLCEACVQDSHRLLLCSICGERALPLAVAGPAVVAERRRAQRDRVEAAYGWVDIARYCFRGDGAWIFWITVALFVAVASGPLLSRGAPSVLRLLPLAFSFLLFVLVLWLVPPQLARIVRATYRGRDEIPGWASAHLVDDRAREIVALLLAGGVGLAPSALLLRLLGCGGEREPPAAVCWTVLLLGLPLMVALAAVGFAAFAEFDRRWLILRVDLHVRFLGAAGRDGWVTAGALIGGLVVVVVLGIALGSLAMLTALAYVLWTGAHAIGVLFRRHREVVERLYAPEAG